MGFFTPWFLAGAVAVGLPIWLHLLRKHRSTPLPFASLMFFEQHVQSSIKHRRLRYLVLFALRTLLILLLVLAFAQPYIRQNILPTRRTGEVAVLAIDNSLSMRAGDRFERARQEARRAIGGLGPGERAQVLAFGQRVQVMGEVTDDHSALNAAVQAIQLSDSKTSFAELTRAVRSIANTLHLPLHLHVYSDMQQSGLPGNFNDLRLNADVRLDAHALETKEVPNFAVENVVAPRRVYDNRKTRVLATVASFGAPKAVRTVSLELNGRTVETKQVEVPESGRATVEFFSLDVPYGRNLYQNGFPLLGPCNTLATSCFSPTTPSDGYTSSKALVESVQLRSPTPMLQRPLLNHQLVNGANIWRTSCDCWCQRIATCLNSTSALPTTATRTSLNSPRPQTPVIIATKRRQRKS